MTPPVSLARASWRTIRASSVVMAGVVVLAVAIGAKAYTASGGARGMISLEALLHTTAFVGLYGHVDALTSAGAFIEWKMGMFLALATIMWSALVATRLTRLSEDEGIWDLLAVSTRGARAALGVVVRLLLLDGLGVGAVLALTLLLDGQRMRDAVAYALGFVGLAWCGAAIGLLSAQLIAPRRSASQVALIVIGALFLLRMLGDVSRAGAVTDLSPFGWLEHLDAFGVVAWCWLLPFVGVTVALGASAARLARRRDVGDATWRRRDHASARLRSVRTPTRFVLRERTTTVVAWSVGFFILGLVFGDLTSALRTLRRSDPSLLTLLHHWGMGAMITPRGYIGDVSVMLAAGLALFVVAALSALGTDLVRGRLETALAVGPGRSSWLVANVVVALGDLAVIVVAGGAGLWLGVEASGTSVPVGWAFASFANAATPALAVLGLALVMAVVTPRVTFPVLGGWLALSYLTAILGPTLHWWVGLIDASPFHWLALVPLHALNVAATIFFTLTGVAGVALATALFRRRDLR